MSPRFVSFRSVSLRFVSFRIIWPPLTSFHYFSFRYVSIRFVSCIPIRSISFNLMSYRSVPFRCVSFRFVSSPPMCFSSFRGDAFRLVTPHVISLHLVALRCAEFLFVSLRLVSTSSRFHFATSQFDACSCVRFVRLILLLVLLLRCISFGFFSIRSDPFRCAAYASSISFHFVSSQFCSFSPIPRHVVSLRPTSLRFLV